MMDMTHTKNAPLFLSLGALLLSTSLAACDGDPPGPTTTGAGSTGAQGSTETDHPGHDTGHDTGTTAGQGSTATSGTQGTSSTGADPDTGSDGSGTTASETTGGVWDGEEGTPCVSTEEDPTGGCVEGFACLELNGHAPHCYRTCGDGGDAGQATCSEYLGNGFPVCNIAIPPPQQATAGATMACAVVCDDPPPIDIPPCEILEVCHGPCPGNWVCDPVGDPSLTVSRCQ